MSIMLLHRQIYNVDSMLDSYAVTSQRTSTHKDQDQVR